MRAQNLHRIIAGGPSEVLTASEGESTAQEEEDSDSFFDTPVGTVTSQQIKRISARNEGPTGIDEKGRPVTKAPGLQSSIRSSAAQAIGPRSSDGTNSDNGNTNLARNI